MIAMLPRIALISTLAVILLAVGGCAAASPSTAPELPATATQDSADAGGTSGSNSGDDGASDATGAGAYLDYTDGVIAETPGAKAALRTFGGGHGVRPPAARSIRSR